MTDNNPLCLEAAELIIFLIFVAYSTNNLSVLERVYGALNKGFAP